MSELSPESEFSGRHHPHRVFWMAMYCWVTKFPKDVAEYMYEIRHRHKEIPTFPPDSIPLRRKHGEGEVYWQEVKKCLEEQLLRLRGNDAK